MPRMIRISSCFFGLLLTLSFCEVRPQSQADEEAQDYFRKWLEEDVVYIISEEEKDIFKSLTTLDEKEQFIEQFWFRRDPDPSTSINEFKEEHYRRIAYANQWFKSGKQGWLTDRGRIYIIHGPPSEIESHPTGGTYLRPFWEGGGSTSTYPFEIWHYRHLEGVGDDIELEFVDPVGGSEYRLALNPDEKDALLHVPGLGLTWREQRGLASKADRLPPTFNTIREKDNPFNRYETYSRVQAPPVVKYDELREYVQVDVRFETFDVRILPLYFRLNEAQVLVAVTVEVPNKELTYRLENGVHLARVAVYGAITSLSGNPVLEFEDDLVSAYRPGELPAMAAVRSLYQRVLTLEAAGRYKMTLVVKDLQSGKVGLNRIALVPPSFDKSSLSASSPILSTDMRQLPEVPEKNEMFVLGDVKIRPNTTNTFPIGSPVGVYLQIYGAGLDQDLLEPSLRVTYSITQQGKTVLEVTNEGPEAVFSFSDRRVILIKPLPVTTLPQGDYELSIHLWDLLDHRELDIRTGFTLAALDAQKSE